MKKGKVRDMNKYRNKKTVKDGMVFDSKKEASRFRELQLLEKAGKIQNLQTQVKFELIPKQEGERATNYIADFMYQENGKTVVEDVKSEITRKNPEYIIKRKLMLYRYEIRIQET